MGFRLVPSFTSASYRPTCAFCGRGPGKENPNDPTSADRDVLSTDLDIDMEGRIEFCRDCAVEIGDVVGMLEPDQASLLLEEVREINNELSKSEDARRTTERALDALLAEFDQRNGPED